MAILIYSMQYSFFGAQAYYKTSTADMARGTDISCATKRGKRVFVLCKLFRLM